MEKIIIFDTTLRDGEQSPGASMNIDEKIQIALQLEKLGVDVIEAGFAASNEADFTAIQKISEQVTNSTVCALSRAISSDIKKAGEALRYAKNKRIHTFIATSNIHMKHKLNMSEKEVLKRAVEAVTYAKSFTNDVEFSCEDAGRSSYTFLIEIIDAVIEAGATTINIPDTVGFMLPSEIGRLVKTVKEYVGERAIISVHNHNDLGLAVANSLEAIENGARQIECTINGIGERAGNAALEEIVMAIKTRKDLFRNIDTNINIKEIYPTSKLVSSITGIKPQPNKAIIGENAFSHESGIHQDGVLKNKFTYEIINPEDIGITDNKNIVLGKLSGRAAFKDKLEELGFNLNETDFNIAFGSFKELASMKKDIFDEDITAIVIGELKEIEEKVSFDRIYFNKISNDIGVSLIVDGEIIKKSVLGNGSIDSIFKGIDSIVGIEGRLIDYKINSITKGKDALAEAHVKVRIDDIIYEGYGLNLDTLSASGLAYLNAVNKFLNN